MSNKIIEIFRTLVVSGISSLLLLGYSCTNLRTQQIECLAQTIGYEAGGEPREGRLAVAEVVHNRATQTGKSYCQVVSEYHYKDNTKVYQFSYHYNDKTQDRTNRYLQKFYKEAVLFTIKNSIIGPTVTTKDTYYFAANYVKYDWVVNSNVKVVTIGNHTFRKGTYRSSATAKYLWDY